MKISKNNTIIYFAISLVILFFSNIFFTNNLESISNSLFVLMVIISGPFSFLLVTPIFLLSVITYILCALPIILTGRSAGQVISWIASIVLWLGAGFLAFLFFD